MTSLTIALLALATFLAGLFLGRRSTARRHQEELTRQAARLQRVIDFADDYIDMTARSRRYHVIRNDEGHIVDLLIRCGTNALVYKDYLEERQRLKSLH